MADNVKRPYPRKTLDQAIRVPKAIKEHNAGNEWDPEQVAAALQLGAKSGNFFYLSGAARDFGLTDGSRDTAVIALTELGRRAVYPSSEGEERQALLDAFLNVDIFRQVVEYYGGNNLPDMQFLSNVLKTRFFLDESLHSEFVELFDKNCRFAGIGTTFSPTVGTGIAGPIATEQTPTVTLGTPKNTQDADSPVCFIIMPFTERDDRHSPGFFTEVLKSLLEPAITQAGFVAKTALRQGSDVIQATIVNDLLAADLVLADLTEHNPNVLFELGMRMAADKPVALIRAKGTGPIFDVDNMLRVQEYDSNLWKSTVERDVPVLLRHIEAAWADRDSGSSFLKILQQQPS